MDVKDELIVKQKEMIGLVKEKIARDKNMIELQKKLIENLAMQVDLLKQRFIPIPPYLIFERMRNETRS